ncbi:hypothetical protein ACHAWU_001987 [Discostella pseudostelligera]|uniref:Uncharacterized protein n=1 Tax=Discostella pseudostelligera TaxID=259834 RepID=A0ABD3MH97_9STRA
MSVYASTQSTSPAKDHVSLFLYNRLQHWIATYMAGNIRTNHQSNRCSILPIPSPWLLMVIHLSREDISHNIMKKPMLLPFPAEHASSSGNPPTWLRS